ncbi:hypothetical protein MKQ68_05395 [Chitinophaga horti]|uniref:Uncharacterized protein n=1 Tax=Chitinophaga horti TaxID=2920382 RepID=A0ABY6J8N1_9BACT|nr:hypothetical protein [Chitinophaga horti]UYQ94524.1 hypothetical protein MKQ68_05395 [Chitinophaga horti]
MSTPDKPQSTPPGGNASNPAPGQSESPGKGLIDKKGEKYLREAGNIEDMPDPEEDQEAIDQEKKLREDE